MPPATAVPSMNDLVRWPTVIESSVIGDAIDYGGELIKLRLIKCPLSTPEDFAVTIKEEQIDRVEGRQLQHLSEW